MRKATAKEGGQYMVNICKSTTRVAQMLQTLPLYAATGGLQLPAFGIVTQNVMCVNAVLLASEAWTNAMGPRAQRKTVCSQSKNRCLLAKRVGRSPWAPAGTA